MSSNASEARRLWPDRRKRPNDHDISNHNYTCRDEQALHVLIHMSLQRTAWALLPLGLCFGVCLSGRDGNYIYVGEGNGRKDEESVLCVNCDTSHPVPRSTRRIGAFYRLLGKRRQLSVQRVAPRNRRSQFDTESRV
jgi:hypothetical protein